MKLQGPFFIMLLIQSVAILFRVVFWIISFYLAVFFHDITPKVSWLEPLMKLCLYVDYCSNLFSVTFNFVLSLNRFLTFMSKNWTSILYDGFNLFFTVIFAVILSVGGAVGMIIPSKVERKFIIEFGFLDIAPEIGFMTALFAVFEIITIKNWNAGNGYLLGTWLKILSVANYLPEISLPIFFIVDNLDFTQKCRRYLGTPTNVQRMST
ncbi:Protein CBG15448 [Caenorhabditis briggsae]|uniref:Protein CBG15448 n=1 Tax=Caenorhabditis briggsae TaxID=6238 RepID=A8XM96_CAEBR|nr:Protein CBG15448 [Caenorhabditis briggsae]CAP33771.2 Protein CBG15448 [Caenorhabditis briggsae]